MPDGAKNAPKGRRRLSRTQIIEILERNAELYKDENFIPYVVELAIYLVEYEYDRDKDGQADASFLMARNTTQEDRPVTAGSENNPIRSKLTVHTAREATNKNVCPYCGKVCGDSLVCPHCHNLTR